MTDVISDRFVLEERTTGGINPPRGSSIKMNLTSLNRCSGGDFLVILTAIRISFYLEAVDLPDRADLAAAIFVAELFN